MVPPEGIEPSASPLPRARSTPELRRHDDNVFVRGLNMTYEVSLYNTPISLYNPPISLYNTPISCYGDFQKLPHIILLTKNKINRWKKRSDQKN